MIEKSAEWRNAPKLKQHLISNGWKTPNTYDNCYACPINGPAVYLFLLHGMDKADGFHDFERAIVAYVGMSSRLAQRWTAHSVLREIESFGNYIQRWFLPTPRQMLRSRELHLIKKFDPPWNILGRERGVFLP